MSHVELAIWATVALLAGPWLYVKGFRTLRTRNLIANTPTARIRSMAIGLVEINGQVQPRSTLGAPFSGKPCAYWEVDIAVRDRRGWSTVHRRQSGNPFYLRDATGVALVYPHGAQCKLHFGTEERFQGLALPACYADYMNANTSVFSRVTRLGVLRFRERMLEAGQHVYVLGTAVPRSRAHVVAAGEPLAATGTDGPVRTRLEDLDRDVAAVIRRGQNESTFIISQESERSLMLSLGARALMQLVGGPALTLFGLGYWVFALSRGHRPW